MMKELTDYSIFDENTGEIIQYLTQEEVEYLKNNFASTTKINDRGERFIPKNDTFNSMIKEYCGSFYFSFYDNILQLENSYLFRFIYLSTFTNYKGYIEFGLSKRDGVLIKKKNIQEILKLKRTETYNTIKYFEENNMIYYDEEGFVMINTNISKRGKLNKAEDRLNHSRIFDEHIRELYENSSSKEHKTIGIMLKLLPYVHFKTNIICSNPNEEDCSRIKPLKLNEILEIINASKTSIRTLMSFKIMNGTESAFMKTSNAFIKNFYIINPRITYKGLSSSVDEDENFLMELSLNYFKIGNC